MVELHAPKSPKPGVFFSFSLLGEKANSGPVLDFDSKYKNTKVKFWSTKRNSVDSKRNCEPWSYLHRSEHWSYYQEYFEKIPSSSIKKFSIPLCTSRLFWRYIHVWVPSMFKASCYASFNFILCRVSKVNDCSNCMLRSIEGSGADWPINILKLYERNKWITFDYLS